MSIVNFENVKITTMTVIANIKGNIEINSAFLLLPITKLNIKDVPKSGKKFKIPWPGKQYAGNIFSANFGGITRGIIKTNKNRLEILSE